LPKGSPPKNNKEIITHGNCGHPSASNSIVPRVSWTLMTPSLYYRSLLNDTDLVSLLPEGLRCALERWREPFVPWDRRSPHWDARTQDCQSPGNWISVSNDNCQHTRMQIHHRIG
jgi:hypothetical protein